MAADGQITRRYLTLQPTVDIPADKQAGMGGGVFIPAGPGTGVLYMDPDELSSSSTLAEFRPRTIVIPDYCFWKLIAQCAELEFDILGVDLVPDPIVDSLYKPEVKRLIETGKTAGDNHQALVRFLEEIRVPITSVEFRDEKLTDPQHRIRLHGSGLITIQGNAEAIEDGMQQFFERLTRFLVEAYLKPSQAESATESSGDSPSVQSASKIFPRLFA